MLNDPIANALSLVLNAERIGKSTCSIYPSSKLMEIIFSLLKEEGYIKNFTKRETLKGNYLDVELAGIINKCNVIKPRFSITKDQYDKFEKRFLPARDFGILLISTSSGVMTNKEAKSKSIGGKLLAYCY